MLEVCRTSSKDREKCYPSMRCRLRDDCCLKPAGLITLNMARCPLDMNRVPPFACFENVSQSHQQPSPFQGL